MEIISGERPTQCGGIKWKCGAQSHEEAALQISTFAKQQSLSQIALATQYSLSIMVDFLPNILVVLPINKSTILKKKSCQSYFLILCTNDV